MLPSVVRSTPALSALLNDLHNKLAGEITDGDLRVASLSK
jgi:hypothetical protein